MARADSPPLLIAFRFEFDKGAKEDEERRDTNQHHRSSEESNFRPLTCSSLRPNLGWLQNVESHVCSMLALQTSGGEHRFGRTTEMRKGTMQNEWATRPKSPALRAAVKTKQGHPTHPRQWPEGDAGVGVSVGVAFVE